MPCDKVAYSTKLRAEELARKLKHDRDVVQFAYRCPECRQWHLTKHKRKNLKVSRYKEERDEYDDRL